MRIALVCLNQNAAEPCPQASFRDFGLEKALRIDIHLYLDIAPHFRPGFQHLADEALNIRLAVRPHHQPEPVTATDQRERCFRRAEDVNAFGVRKPRAWVSASARELAETTIPASRPKGGKPARSRSRVSRS